MKLLLACALLCGAVVLSGCTFSGSASLEEEKEPHFLEGKTRVNSMDYAGAIESFEQALEVNPKSAAAHFELACLCEQREADPAAAIYHYRRYLKLRPRGERVDRARSRIGVCQQQLAQAVSLGPVTQGLQHEYEGLNEQIRKLTEENKALKEKLEQWQSSAVVARTPALSPTSEVAAARPRAMTPVESVAARVAFTDRNNRIAGLRENTFDRTAISTAKTHTVAAGETPMAIAKKYGIRLESLMAANPRLEPRRLRVGQSLSIPAS